MRKDDSAQLFLAGKAATSPALPHNSSRTNPPVGCITLPLHTDWSPARGFCSAFPDTLCVKGIFPTVGAQVWSTTLVSGKGLLDQALSLYRMGSVTSEPMRWSWKLPMIFTINCSRRRHGRGEGGGGTRLESCCFITQKVLQIMWVSYLTASLSFRENAVIAFGTHVRAAL